MNRLHIDIETYSDVDLKTGGLFKYVQSPKFQILLVAYAINDQETNILDLTKEPMPEGLIKILSNSEYLKVAHNAFFEFTCFNKFIPEISLGQWECSMLKASYCGYPASLEAAGKAIGIPSDKAKLSTGKALIKYFCVPCKPTRSNGFRERNLPHHEPEKWELFKEYCKGDVVAEREIDKILAPYILPASEWVNWFYDYEINKKGIQIDTELVINAIEIDEEIKNINMQKAIVLTGLDNPKSNKQLLEWLSDEVGEEVESIAKDKINGIIEQFDNDIVTEVLEIKKLLSKTSTSKYKAMLNALCNDNRVRGVLQFYGANRTGRWAGRLVQVQNLPRNSLPYLDIPRNLIKNRDIEMLNIIYGDQVPSVLSQLIRTAFVAKEGHTFVVADYSAIEARVIAWLADELWRLDVFNGHGKIYEASASAMFGVPIEKISEGNPEYALRSKGKIAELALGYQGSVGALKQMGALSMGIEEEKLPELIALWRGSNKRIVDFWYKVQAAAIDTVKTGNINQAGFISFQRDEKHLMINLPSGRQLFYVNPRLVPGQYGDQIIYKGLNQMTRKWEDQQTYGGKLVENITQAVARDCLALLIERLRLIDYPVMHIHDEVVFETKKEEAEYFLGICLEEMAKPIEWAPGLPLKGAGFISDYYKKD